MKKWTIWRRGTFFSVQGPETVGHIEVIELTPIKRLVGEISLNMRGKKSLMGVDFWDKLNELIKVFEEKDE